MATMKPWDCAIVSEDRAMRAIEDGEYLTNTMVEMAGGNCDLQSFESLWETFADVSEDSDFARPAAYAVQL